MENMGFVYSGHFIESETDLSGDQAFAQALHQNNGGQKGPCE
jgi:hypothetical protein